MQCKNDIDIVFSKQLKNTNPITLNNRINYLNSIENWIINNKSKIYEAHFKDLKKPESEIEIAEVWYVLSEIKIAKKNLKKWMRPKKKGSSTLALSTASSWIHYEPKGVVLIIAPWNFPFNLTIGPIISSLAAGNRIIVKPSEITPNVSLLIEHMINTLFPIEHIAVFQGDYKIAKRLLQLPFHHIFFTGSPRIGKTVMKAAAEHLSSLTLELGGKSPTIIDKTANINMAVNKLVWGKCLNLGQSCIAPDYVLIHKSKKELFIDLLSKRINNIYGSSYKNKSQSSYLARIVNEKHWERLDKLLTSALEDGANIVHGGEKNKLDLFIEPTILDSVKLDMDIMIEEIFGPILPIISFEELEDCINIINNRTKPLALYMFSNSEKNINNVIKKTSSGGMVINEVKSHFLNLNLPFGGVNASGLGRSHGYNGFLAFSNERSMLRNGVLSMVGLIFPPYTNYKMKIIRLVSRFF
ncbi:MAG: aldehyde dehydrogenase family protein [Candidatus Marinimicrobia bacterium]|nr:aldehyde dehydrogenase family protein [Candidatus Neomarinimicrobiota bacterium]